MDTFPNLVAMFRASADRFGPRAALRFKRDGLYHDISWNDYRSAADAVSARLIELGIRPGDRVGILSENRPEWFLADLGILGAGAADVPLHAPLAAPQVAYQLSHSGARGVFVGNREQLSKVLQVRHELPNLEWIVAFDSVDDPSALPWIGLLQAGRHAHPSVRNQVDAVVGSLDADDLATIIYTSGTTGRPKGVMLTHGNLVSNTFATAISRGMGSEDVLLSWLPYSHIYARTCDEYVSILAGTTVCLATSIDSLVLNLSEIEPTEFTSVPRFYEKVWSAVEGLPPEERTTRLRRIFGPRIRRLSSGGAPLPKHVARGFGAAGLPLYEGYGLTESSPVISFNTAEHDKPGTVGRAITGVEIKIAEDGEILTRGPHVMKGYWNDREATDRAIIDGWLHTGDVGMIDAEGFLTITDRKKDLIITSGGKNIAPSELERLLVSDPYIEQALVYGDGRPFVSALLVPNLGLLVAKASELGCALDIQDDLIRNTVILRFLQDRVAQIMEAVSHPERVKAIVVLGRSLSVETDELTPTQKVRRRFVLENFRSEFDAIYSSTDSKRRLLSDDL